MLRHCLHKASKGDVRAIAELANRLEGRPAQAMALDFAADSQLNEITVRFVEPGDMSDDELVAAMRRYEDELGITAMKEGIRQLEEELRRKEVPCA